MEDIFNLLKNGFAQIPFNNLLGATITELEKDRAIVTLPWKSELERSNGTVHGGVVASLLDLAGAAAVSSNLGADARRVPSTISLLVHYLKPAGKEDLLSEAKVIRRTRSFAFIEASVKTRSGDLLATGSIIYRIR